MVALLSATASTVATASAVGDPFPGKRRHGPRHRRPNLRRDLPPLPSPPLPRPPRGDSAASPSSTTLAQEGQARGGGITACGPRGGGRFSTSRPLEARGRRQSALDPTATSPQPATRHRPAAATPHPSRQDKGRRNNLTVGRLRTGNSLNVHFDRRPVRQLPLGDCLPCR